MKNVDGLLYKWKRKKNVGILLKNPQKGSLIFCITSSAYILHSTWSCVFMKTHIQLFIIIFGRLQL